MKKLAVLFSDMDYATDLPLMYYSKGLLAEHGFEAVSFDYDADKLKKYSELVKEKPDPTSHLFKEEILSYVAEAQKEASERMKKIAWTTFDELMFVSKGAGSIIATLFAKTHGLNPAHIMYAPLEAVFNFLGDEEGIVFCGEKDEYIKYDRLKEYCKKSNLVVYHFEKCDHSLECGSVETNLKNIGRFMAMTDAFLKTSDKTVYDFSVKNREKQVESLGKYAGEVLLIVNTATGCGFTPQYSKLEDLYQKYHKQGFSLLDFPCNQFLNQAPGTDVEIHSFCESKYNIHFPQYAKISVNGEDADPLFVYLKAKRGFKGFDLNTLDGQFLDKKIRAEFPDYETNSDIKWNFTKFLVNKKGHVVERYEPTTDIDIIAKDVERLLNE